MRQLRSLRRCPAAVGRAVLILHHHSMLVLDGSGASADDCFDSLFLDVDLGACWFDHFANAHVRYVHCVWSVLVGRPARCFEAVDVLLEFSDVVVIRACVIYTV